MHSPIATGAAGSAINVIDALEGARAWTLALVASVSDEDLERVHSALMSPLVWDLGHIAAFEDLWLVHRYGRRPLLREDLIEVYDAMETPRARRGELPFLRPAQACRHSPGRRGPSRAAKGHQGPCCPTGFRCRLSVIIKME